MEIKPQCYRRAKYLNGSVFLEQQIAPDTDNIKIEFINVFSLHIKIKHSCCTKLFVIAVNLILHLIPSGFIGYLKTECRHCTTITYLLTYCMEQSPS